MKYHKLSDVPAQKWQELAQKKIYFGHQSVGFNIIDGIKLIEKEYPDIKLRIVEGRSLSKVDGELLHSRVGENTKPLTKIYDFLNVINQELGGIPDAVALKFCYVDVNDKVNIQEVFSHYKEAMAKLKNEYPDMTLIHFTIPLRTQPISWKTRAKLLIGKEPWEFKDNIKRNLFNRMLLAEYQDKEPIFDIASIEATQLTGQKVQFRVNGHNYLALNPYYSSDGGHLNEKGRKKVAEEFLLFLVNLLPCQ